MRRASGMAEYTQKQEPMISTYEVCTPDTATLKFLDETKDTPVEYPTSEGLYSLRISIDLITYEDRSIM